jgi:hypothetical protein
VILFPGAIADLPGEVFLNHDLGPVSASISQKPNGKDVTLVAAYSIGDLFLRDQIDAVQFIKLDVEGAELLALKGAAPLLKKHRPSNCVEAQTCEAYLQVAEFLHPMGYRPYVFNSRGDLNAFRTFAPSPNVFFFPRAHVGKHKRLTGPTLKTQI